MSDYDPVCIRHPDSDLAVPFGEVSYCGLCLQEFLDRHSVERMRELTPDERAALAKQEVTAKAEADKAEIDKKATEEKEKIAKELDRRAVEDEEKDREADKAAIDPDQNGVENVSNAQPVDAVPTNTPAPQPAP